MSCIHFYFSVDISFIWNPNFHDIFWFSCFCLKYKYKIERFHSTIVGDYMLVFNYITFYGSGTCDAYLYGELGLAICYVYANHNFGSRNALYNWSFRYFCLHSYTSECII